MRYCVFPRKSVPLHQILKIYVTMSRIFKNIFRFAQVSFIALLCAGCDVGDNPQASSPIPSDKPLYVAGVTSGLTHKEKDNVLKDTITPPDNPMNEVPIVPGTHAFRGVLELKEFDGRLHCAIRSVNNDYFLTDNGATYLIRLNHPLLSDCAVGDTIVVTAEPMKLISNFSLATYYVQPNK